jgi:hypothetical protein
MLYTDKLFISQADMATLDSEVPSIANAEQITIDGVNGIAQRVYEECARELQGKMVSFSSQVSVGGLSSAHISAVLNTGGDATQRSNLLLNNVVVSGRTRATWSAIRNWAVYRAMVMFFSRAANKDLDRYVERKMSFELECRTIWNHLLRDGLPYLRTPLAAPAAYLSRSPGSWQTSLVAGSGTSTSTIHVAIAYKGMGSTTNNESEISTPQSVLMESGKVLRVDLTSLIPPTSIPDVEDRAKALITPMAATHYLVYCGSTSDGPFYLQTPDPISLEDRVFLFTNNPVLSGVTAGCGQYPDKYLVIPNNQTFRS